MRCAAHWRRSTKPRAWIGADASRLLRVAIAARALGSRRRHDDQAAVRHAGRRRGGLQPAQARSALALLPYLHDVDAAPGAERRRAARRPAQCQACVGWAVVAARSAWAVALAGLAAR